MKNNEIKVYTLYKSLNFGAYLQAFALQHILKENGYSPSFIEVNPFSNKEIKKYIIRKDIRKIFINYLQYKKFKSCWKHVKINNNDVEYAKACVVGSDEIWNIKNKSFFHAPEYFGYNINNNNIISYAPSCNLTTSKDLISFDASIKFEKFSKISVRDNHTFYLVKEISGVAPTIVLDPTLLIKDFKNFESNIYVNHKYILIYGYKFAKHEIEKILNFAKKMNYKLYSIGMPQMWCDRQITATPFEFLSFVKNADYIITETFHGTIFSIIYNKNFVSFVNGKSKLEDLLLKFNLMERDENNTNEIKIILKKKINYKEVNKILEKEREKSIKWLIDAIEKK